MCNTCRQKTDLTPFRDSSSSYSGLLFACLVRRIASASSFYPLSGRTARDLEPLPPLPHGEPLRSGSGPLLPATAARLTRVSTETSSGPTASAGAVREPLLLRLQ